MADYAMTITDSIGGLDTSAAGTFWEDKVDPLGITDAASWVVPYVVTITDRLSLMDSRDVEHGRRYPRKGRSQHGAAPATSIPYRSRILGRR